MTTHEASTTYTSMQVANMLNIPQRTLMHWQEWGLVRPEGGKGRGKNTIWTSKEVREASIIAALRASRISMQKLRDVLEYLRSVNPVIKEFMVANNKAEHPKDMIAFCDSNDALAVIRENKGMHIFSLWTPEEVG